jgi:hypothetical protein
MNRYKIVHLMRLTEPEEETPEHSMSPDRRQLWADYLAHLANRLGMFNVVTRISRMTAQSGALADCNSLDTRKLHTLRFSETFEDASAEDQREALVHELLHWHFDHPYQMAFEHTQKLMAYDYWLLFYQEFDRTMELGIDGIAHAIAVFYPLPGEVIPELEKKVKKSKKLKKSEHIV